MVARGLFSSRVKPTIFLKNAGYCKYDLRAEELENKTHQSFITNKENNDAKE